MATLTRDGFLEALLDADDALVAEAVADAEFERPAVRPASIENRGIKCGSSSRAGVCCRTRGHTDADVWNPAKHVSFDSDEYCDWPVGSTGLAKDERRVLADPQARKVALAIVGDGLRSTAELVADVQQIVSVLGSNDDAVGMFGRLAPDFEGGWADLAKSVVHISHH
jgi:hypothetical protein